MGKKGIGCGEGLHVVFHNPNSPEDTARYLIKIMAAGLADRAARGVLHESSDLQQASVRKLRNTDIGLDPAHRK